MAVLATALALRRAPAATLFPRRVSTARAATRLMATKDPRSERPQRSYTDQFRNAAQEGILLTPIAHVESPYKERFGTPRQATVTNYTTGGVAQDGAIVFRRDFPYRDALCDLDGFSHVWVITHLHLNLGWKPKVTPPRGPKRRRGVFATRAPHRPNQLGLSALEITTVDVEGGRVGVRGLDILDGTPVLDVKPYLPYCDAFPTARAGWIDELDGTGSAEQADRLDYWPPPPHLRPSVEGAPGDGYRRPR